MASANVFEMVHGEKLEKLHHALKTDHSASFLFLIGEIMVSDFITFHAMCVRPWWQTREL